MVRPKSKPKQNVASAAKAEPFIASGPLPVPRELLSAGVPLDPEVEMERQKRLEELKAKLMGMAARGEFGRAVDEVLSVVVELERSNDRLAWRADFAHRGQPFQCIVITRIGHRDRSEATQTVSWSVCWLSLGLAA